MTSEEPGSPPFPLYYQLKAELDVSFRRYVKEMADEIVKRIDRSEGERREERKELEHRVRRLEEQTASMRATGKLLVTLFGFALTAVSIGVGVIALL